MGMRLRSPLVASASPLTAEVGSIRALAQAGAGAIVLHSLFQEQIEHDADELDHYLHYGTERFPESLTYFPREPQYKLGPEAYLDLVRDAKRAVDVPVIASLNGTSQRGWIDYSRQVVEAGADAIECNVYYIPTDPRLTSQEVENVYMDVLRAIKAAVKTPVAMKLSPYFSSTANMLHRLAGTGADALVLFNRFYQPDLDVERLEAAATLYLSTSQELRLPLRWIALMYGRVNCSLAATSGVHTGMDAAKAIMAGANVAMMTSALLKHGPQHIATVERELRAILEMHEYNSLQQAMGVLSQRNCPDPAAYERANYMRILTTYGQTATFE
jgi:dihydroorotate dehydrogenase (fumarate)